ncbi:DHHC zinc finger protein (macronuclear) [Tetrahymena thermophila SB210]|uniref:Palmitoyltransferase n=1 Tax=Tetrahymena thermophila (strain SB210) TaxID=312017 RepID=I7MJI6_TETTS|nr:DHHC zinc finger protein [Tetrahymena thermophila SB210]EAS06291.1 DHHC zinc finger protein [Tetrahymena thermophila SB210]|eukprot:XP_001026536.1 DHHC zinc finger protein [Tetrahymena thermophila SB210]
MKESESYEDISSSDDDDNEETKNSNQGNNKQVSKCDILLGRTLQVVTIVLLLLSNYIVYSLFLRRWFKEDRKFYLMIRGIELDNTGTCLFILYQTFFFLAIISYFKASLSDPGFLKNLKPPSELLEENQIIYCQKCPDKKWKPQRAHHCKTCQKCVFRMDHHCTWINNCVGLKNQKYFILFLVHCEIYCILLIIYLVFSAVLLYQNTPKLFMLFIGMTWKHLVAILFIVLSALFIFLINEFLSDQYDCLKTNQTTVESYKEKFGRPYSFFNQLQLVFGQDQFYWLIPTKPKYNCNYLELLYNGEELAEMLQSNADFIEDHFYNQQSEIYEACRKYKVS